MKFANIREMHQPSAVGVTKEYSHDEFGTWVGVKVVDDIAWKKVKEQVYKGFSTISRENLNQLAQTLPPQNYSLLLLCKLLFGYLMFYLPYEIKQGFWLALLLH